jgi:hypothetical protein
MDYGDMLISGIVSFIVTLALMTIVFWNDRNGGGRS